MLYYCWRCCCFCLGGSCIERKTIAINIGRWTWKKALYSFRRYYCVHMVIKRLINLHVATLTIGWMAPLLTDFIISNKKENTTKEDEQKKTKNTEKYDLYSELMEPFWIQTNRFKHIRNMARVSWIIIPYYSAFIGNRWEESCRKNP